jgi:cell division protein FtsB
MNFFKIKIQHLRSWITEIGVLSPQFIGIVVLAVVGLSVVWNGTRVIQQNYGLLQKIAVLEEENRILELENRNKEIQNDYYKSAEFAELKARRVNGKAVAGEQVFLISDETALASLKTPEDDGSDSQPQNSKPRYQQNFEAWIDFFFGS